MAGVDENFIVMSSANGLLLILNTVGNILVIQAIVKAHRLRSASNCLVANLAICDLLSPLLNIPTDISVGLSQHRWHYGPVLCRIIWPGATMMTTSSALTLVTISVDRFRALKHPFVKKVTKYQALGIIFVVHSISFLVILPYAVASVVLDDKCVENWSDSLFNSREYTLITFFVQYVIPLLILTFVYCNAAIYLRRCSLGLVKFTEVTSRKSHAQKSLIKSRGLIIRRQQNTRVMKMFAVIVLVFALFTLPNNVRWLVKDFGSYVNHTNQDFVHFLCVFFTYLNCFANPIIYGTFSKDFKTSFLHVLTFGRYRNAYDVRISHTPLSRLPSSKQGQARRSTSKKNTTF